MKRLMTFAAAGMAAFLNAETLTVEKEASWSVTSAATYEKVTVHGNLTVSGARLSIPDGTGVNGAEQVVVSLGSDTGDAATLTVKDGGELGQAAGKGEILEVGANGGWGRVDVQSAADNAFRLRYFDIAAAATPPEGDPTVLTVGGTVNLRSLRNKSSKTVKVEFAGGKLNATDSSGFVWFENGQEEGAFVLEGREGSAIRFCNNGQPVRVLSKGGKVKTAGPCAFIAEGWVSKDAWTKLVLSDSGVVWENTGDFRLQEGVDVTCDGALPTGAQTGSVVFDAVKSKIPLVLDLNGCTNAVNGIVDMKGDSVVTNSSAKVLSVLRLGTAKGGAFSARAGGQLRIEQQGQEIALSNAVVDCAYVLCNGTLRVTGDSSIATLDAGKDTAVIVDGVTLTLGTLRDNGATFTCENGGKIVLSKGGTGVRGIGVAGGMLAPSLNGSGTLEKTGAETLVVHQETAAFPWSVHVAEGILRFSGTGGCTNEWWRWTIKEANAWIVELASIGLFRPTAEPEKWMPEPTLNVKPAPAGTSAEELAQNQSFIDSAIRLDRESETSGTYATGYDNLFANNPARIFRTQSTQIPYANKPESWIPVTFRIASDHIVGYSQRMGWTTASRFPRVFSLETSANGTEWTTALSVDSLVWSGAASWYLGTTDSATRASCPNPLTIAGYDAPGAAGLAAGVDVRVDAGATLDLANVTEEAARTVSSLTVDMSKGGGTIRGLAVAETGTLTLVNVASKSALKNALILSLPDAVGAPNFANWTLRVDGKVLARQIVWRDGAVRILPPGCLFILK